MLDNNFIEELREKKLADSLSQKQGKIIIILLVLVLIVLIMICFFVFDTRELNWLILQELKR
jgi:hypothetical protein